MLSMDRKAESLDLAPFPKEKDPNIAEAEDDYPDGGLQAWSVVFGSFCAMVPSMGLLNSLGILHVWTSTHQLQDYSESSIGWIYGAYGFFLFLGGAQAGKSFQLYQNTFNLNSYTSSMIGPIFDAHGVHKVVIPGSLGIVAALVCLSFSEGAYSPRNGSTTYQHLH